MDEGEQRSWEAGGIHQEVANHMLHLDADQAKLKSAPPFAMSQWAGFRSEFILGEILSGRLESGTGTNLDLNENK